MKKQATILLLLLTITTSFGCSKFRGLTRRDYALLRDPFASKAVDENGNQLVADSDEPPVPGVTASTAGFVNIGDPEKGAAPSGDLTNRVTADYGAADSSAQNRLDSGSASGFQGVRVRGMGDTISTETGPAQARVASRAPNPFAQSPTPDSDTPEQDMADMAAFIQGQATASGLTETADDLGEDFAAFAEERTQKWKEDVAKVNQAATPLIQQASQRTELPSGNDAFVNERSIATPLIQRAATSAANASPFAAPSKATQPPPPVGSIGPFAPISLSEHDQSKSPVPKPVFDPPAVAEEVAKDVNPFAVFEQSPSAQSKASSAGPATTLDAGFGWRRANPDSR